MCFLMIKHYRDVDFLPLTEDKFLVIACDSCGAIGNKKLDQVKISPYNVGQYTTRVVIMEILSIGARLVALTAAICNEPEPTGSQILKGMREELTRVNLFDIPITISTEKNMKTQQTALGVSGVGVCERKNLRMGRTKVGDYIYAIGVPKVGNEILKDQGEIADCKVLKQILKIEEIGDIIPVGSQGIAGECRKLAQYLNGHFERFSSLEIDIEKSAGPCTTIVMTSPKKINLKDKVGIPFFYVGRIINK